MQGCGMTLLTAIEATQFRLNQLQIFFAVLNLTQQRHEIVTHDRRIRSLNQKYSWCVCIWAWDRRIRTGVGVVLSIERGTSKD